MPRTYSKFDLRLSPSRRRESPGRIDALRAPPKGRPGDRLPQHRAFHQLPKETKRGSAVQRRALCIHLYWESAAVVKLTAKRCDIGI